MTEPARRHAQDRHEQQRDDAARLHRRRERDQHQGLGQQVQSAVGWMPVLAQVRGVEGLE
jgi:hypothetical protein